MNSFYADLHDAVGTFPAGNMMIVAGDWNARRGRVTEIEENNFHVAMGWSR